MAMIPPKVAEARARKIRYSRSKSRPAENIRKEIDEETDRVLKEYDDQQFQEALQKQEQEQSQQDVPADVTAKEKATIQALKLQDKKRYGDPSSPRLDGGYEYLPLRTSEEARSFNVDTRSREYDSSILIGTTSGTVVAGGTGAPSFVRASKEGTSLVVRQAATKKIEPPSVVAEVADVFVSPVKGYIKSGSLGTVPGGTQTYNQIRTGQAAAELVGLNNSGWRADPDIKNAVIDTATFAAGSVFGKAVGVGGRIAPKLTRTVVVGTGLSALGGAGVGIATSQNKPVAVAETVKSFALFGGGVAAAGNPLTPFKVRGKENVLFFRSSPPLGSTATTTSYSASNVRGFRFGEGAIQKSYGDGFFSVTNVKGRKATTDFYKTNRNLEPKLVTTKTQKLPSSQTTIGKAVKLFETQQIEIDVAGGTKTRAGTQNVVVDITPIEIVSRKGLLKKTTKGDLVRTTKVKDFAEAKAEGGTTTFVQPGQQIRVVDVRPVVYERGGTRQEFSDFLGIEFSGESAKFDLVKAPRDFQATLSSSTTKGVLKSYKSLTFDPLAVRGKRATTSVVPTSSQFRGTQGLRGTGSSFGILDTSLGYRSGIRGLVGQSTGTVSRQGVRVGSGVGSRSSSNVFQGVEQNLGVRQELGVNQGISPKVFQGVEQNLGIKQELGVTQRLEQSQRLDQQLSTTQQLTTISLQKTRGRTRSPIRIPQILPPVPPPPIIGDFNLAPRTNTTSTRKGRKKIRERRGYTPSLFGLSVGLRTPRSQAKQLSLTGLNIRGRLI